MRRDDVDLPVAPAHDRPHAYYRCGKACAGDQRLSQSCPLGPSATGVCRHDKKPCIPVPTAFAWSKRWRLSSFVCGLLLLGISSYLWGREFYKPGPLSTPHAQILAGQMTSASCAACHPQAEKSPLAWFLSGHDGIATLQSDRCMSCHHTRLPNEFARTAHNLSASQLAQLRSENHQASNVSFNRLLPRPEFSQMDVACSACHREHGGANADLTSLSDAQCQTCHSNRFTSFAVDHPAWQDWPYTTSEPIAFDHRSHAQRHFPATRDALNHSTKFDCIQCHAKTATGEFARIVDYATACGTCHDKALNQQTRERLDLFVLPGLVAPDAVSVGVWPTAATGFYDGKINPLARLLLSTDEAVLRSIEALPGDGDFGRINPDDAEQREAAETIAVSIRNLMTNMATQGPIPVANHMTEQTAAWGAILQGLPPQLIWDASQRWFNGTMPIAMNPGNGAPHSTFRMAAARTNASPDDRLLDDDFDLLMADPLAADPASAPTQASRPLVLDPSTMQPSGGWYADDSRIAISYRGHGHADPVIRAAIELAAGLPQDNSIRRELLASGPAIACIQCHPGVKDMGTVIWKPMPSAAKAKSTFTKFSHQPHNNIPLLVDCKHCHAISEDSTLETGLDLTTVALSDSSTASSTASNEATIRTAATHDFCRMTRQTCVGCHIPEAAGDSCIKCHRYHTEPMTGF